MTILQELQKAADPARAKLVAGYFKTGKGQYGEGDVFLGLSMPIQRLIAKKYLDLSLKELQTLLSSKIHEHRMAALIILVEQFRKADETKRGDIYKFYLKNTHRINNWDLVDTSAGYIVGGYILNRPKKVLTKLAKSKLLWERRIAIIATSRFISEGKFTETFKIAEILLHDKHDLIHKAVGWMLREVGKKNLAAEERFLKKHYQTMPRTTLRYAIERMPRQKRLSYLK